MTEDARISEKTISLPFDPDEATLNLRYERYLSSSIAAKGETAWTQNESKVRWLYYLLRPLMPVAVRKYLQKIALRGWRKIDFPAWPVDMSVERMLNEILRMILISSGEEKIPFIWFWPDGHRACMIMTHDVETEAGRNFCDELMDMNDAFGIKSSFQIVPEKRYEVTESFINGIALRGHEVNVHGLSHDGHLFDDYEEFLRRTSLINSYGAGFGAAGFRSPVMYRNAEWMTALDFAYDMSFPNTAHLDPQRGGCATITPYFIGDLLELPLTMLQDYTLFNILRRRSIDLWKYQADLLIANHGLVSFIVHPDYVILPRYQELYRSLLRFLSEVCREQNVINMLPRDLNTWWRQRSKMRIVGREGFWKIEGEGSSRARIAYAMLQRKGVVFEIQPEHTSAVSKAPGEEISA